MTLELTQAEHQLDGADDRSEQGTRDYGALVGRGQREHVDERAAVEDQEAGEVVEDGEADRVGADHVGGEAKEWWRR